MEKDTVRIDSGGRVVIPARYRRALGLHEGDRLTIGLKDGELRLSTLRQAVVKAQSIVRKGIEPGRSLVNELLAERRAESARG